MNKNFRLKKLEKAQPAEKTVFIVDWTPAGEEQEKKPGVIYLTWNEGEESGQEEQAEQDE